MLPNGKGGELRGVPRHATHRPLPVAFELGDARRYATDERAVPTGGCPTAAQASAPARDIPCWSSRSRGGGRQAMRCLCLHPAPARERGGSATRAGRRLEKSRACRCWGRGPSRQVHRTTRRPSWTRSRLGTEANRRGLAFPAWPQRHQVLVLGRSAQPREYRYGLTSTWPPWTLRPGARECARHRFRSPRQRRLGGGSGLQRSPEFYADGAVCPGRRHPLVTSGKEKSGRME